MKNTAQKLILVSFILALLATVTVFVYLKSLKSPEETPAKITVLVAAETIPPRTLIDRKMIKEIQVSDDSVFSDYMKDSSKIIGKYTKETIFENEGFNKNKIMENDTNELSLKIANNYRAVSISVTGDTGVSSLLKPGDYVDVVSYIAEKKDGTNEARTDKAKIILQKIEVLAVDAQLDREDQENTDKDDTEQAITNFLVTLSIPTLEVEKLILAESLGSIKLTLRPLKDDSTANTEGATWEKIYADSPSQKENTSTTSSATKSATKSETKYISYTIKRGDSLRKISSDFYGDKSKYTIIMGANNIKDENLIKAGEVIRIPKLK